MSENFDNGKHGNDFENVDAADVPAPAAVGDKMPDINSSLKVYKGCGEKYYTYDNSGLTKYPSFMTDSKQWAARVEKRPFVKDSKNSKKISGSWNDSNNWLSYAEAIDASDKKVWVWDNGKDTQINGIGFLTKEDNDLKIVVGDLDACRDPESGWISPFAQSIVDYIRPFDSEVSYSECGVRFIAKGDISLTSLNINGPQDDIPEEVKQRIIKRKPKIQEKLNEGKLAWNGVEIYNRINHHATLTGVRINELCFPFEDRTEALKNCVDLLLLYDKTNKNDDKKGKKNTTKKAGRPKNKDGQKTLPPISVKKLLETSKVLKGFENAWGKWMGPHPHFGSVNGKNLVFDEETDLFTNFHDGVNNGGDVWIWLAMESGLIGWDADGTGALDDPDVLRSVKEYAIQEGYFTRNELEEKSPKKEKRDSVEMLVDAVKYLLTKDPEARMIFNEHRQPFLWAKLNDNFEMIPVNADSKTFKKFCFRIVKELYKFSLKDDNTFKNAMINIEVSGEDITKEKGFEIQPSEMGYRRTWYNDAVWFDLCNKEWSGIRIDSDGYRKEPLPPVFLRNGKEIEQIEPIYDADPKEIDRIFKYVNIKDENFELKNEEFQRLLIKAWVCSSFMVKFRGINFGQPILSIGGSHGTGKTESARFIKNIIDPSAEDVISIQKKLDDLCVTLNNNSSIVIDNVGAAIDPDTSDVLCRSITKSTYPKRKLYTDEEEVILKLACNIIITSIFIKKLQDDVIDRTVFVETEKFDEKSERKSLEELQLEFKEDLPYILGGIFASISEALKGHKEVLEQHKSKKTPDVRMLDFALFSESLSRVWGNEDWRFFEVYNSMQGKKIKENANSNTLLSAFVEFMKEKKSYTGAMTPLHTDFKTYCDKNDLAFEFSKKMKIPAQLTTWLKGMDSKLNTFGIIYSSSTEGKSTTQHTFKYIE